MKKFAQLISLALVAVMCVALLASCAPASDPAKAEKALKDAGYTAVKDTTITPAVYKRLIGKNVEAVLTGTKTDDDKNVQHKRAYKYVCQSFFPPAVCFLLSICQSAAIIPFRT